MQPTDEISMSSFDSGFSARSIDSQASTRELITVLRYDCLLRFFTSFWFKIALYSFIALFVLQYLLVFGREIYIILARGNSTMTGHGNVSELNSTLGYGHT